jgi:hypothetical protein
MRDGHGDELLGLRRQGAVGEHLVAELLERRANLGRELLTLLRELFRRGG